MESSAQNAASAAAQNAAVKLVARDIHKRFGENEVLKGVSLAANAGDVPLIAGHVTVAGQLSVSALVSWPALIADPALAAPYAHVVALDPPPWQAALAHATVLAWGAPVAVASTAKLTLHVRVETASSATPKLRVRARPSCTAPRLANITS